MEKRVWCFIFLFIIQVKCIQDDWTVIDSLFDQYALAEDAVKNVKAGGNHLLHSKDRVEEDFDFIDLEEFPGGYDLRDLGSESEKERFEDVGFEDVPVPVVKDSKADGEELEEIDLEDHVEYDFRDLNPESERFEEIHVDAPVVDGKQDQAEFTVIDETDDESDAILINRETAKEEDLDLASYVVIDKDEYDDIIEEYDDVIADEGLEGNENSIPSRLQAKILINREIPKEEDLDLSSYVVIDKDEYDDIIEEYDDVIADEGLEGNENSIPSRLQAKVLMIIDHIMNFFSRYADMFDYVKVSKDIPEEVNGVEPISGVLEKSKEFARGIKQKVVGSGRYLVDKVKDKLKEQKSFKKLYKIYGYVEKYKNTVKTAKMLVESVKASVKDPNVWLAASSSLVDIRFGFFHSLVYLFKVKVVPYLKEQLEMQPDNEMVKSQLNLIDLFEQYGTSSIHVLFGLNVLARAFIYGN
ncbi:hypothetical protein O9G_005990 [Rozella allomycis CSF55]|uniref:Uncharacterized protein n=2 Tax=Rozella allomycis (strain CSF55) TaxID=988480 RepID=A0A075ANI5_ROZAC|nr:hypothetical protein O9G_005990 [Rozella allomycis CSF55]|eukprot:EPZ31389.1 hypothetical protein O9G_005990 [Rozella allomycis CSF55]